MECDGLGFDFALLDVDFIAGQDNGDVFANADEITYLSALDLLRRIDVYSLTVPVGNILVRDP